MPNLHIPPSALSSSGKRRKKTVLNSTYIQFLGEGVGESPRTEAGITTSPAAFSLHLGVHVRSTYLLRVQINILAALPGTALAPGMWHAVA